MKVRLLILLLLIATAVTAGEPNHDAIELVTPSERIQARAVVNAAEEWKVWSHKPTE